MAGPYARPVHGSAGNDGSATDATVIIGELSAGLEDVEQGLQDEAAARAAADLSLADTIGGVGDSVATKVPLSALTAQSLLGAVSDGVPAALTVPTSTLVGRAASGDIAALTPAVVRALLGLATVAVSGDYGDLTDAPDLTGIERTWLSNITWPQVAAHQTGQNEFGESTLWAGDECCAAGIRVLETDFRWTSDGEIILMHDSTVDRTTTGTGDVSALTAAQMSALRVDVPAQLYATGYTDQLVPTLAEFVDRFRGRAILAVEQKARTAADVPALAAAYRAAGGRDCMIVQSFIPSVAEAWAAQGFQSMLLTNAAVADPSALYATGVRWVGYEFTGTGTAAEISRISAAKAAGLRVATWTHIRRYQVEAALAAGSDMPMTNYPAHAVSAEGYYSVDFAENLRGRGLIPRDEVTPLVSGGYLTDQNNAITEGHFLIGGCGPIPGGAGSSFTLRWVQRFNVSGSWGGVYLSGPADDGYKASDGYHVLVRQSGVLNLYRLAGGVPMPLNTVTAAALTLGVDYECELVVTPAGLTLRVVDTGTTLTNTTTAATSFRPSRWWPYWGRNSNVAGVVSLKSMEVTA